MKPHIEMLELLGVEGMSSDESDREGDQDQYWILPPLWRDERLTTWLRAFDSVHHLLRKSGDPTALRGAFPHIRHPTKRKSDSNGFVPGLPINAYDEDWFQQQSVPKLILHPSNNQYDFTHDPHLMEYVSCFFVC